MQLPIPPPQPYVSVVTDVKQLKSSKLITSLIKYFLLCSTENNEYCESKINQVVN